MSSPRLPQGTNRSRSLDEFFGEKRNKCIEKIFRISNKVYYRYYECRGQKFLGLYIRDAYGEANVRMWSGRWAEEKLAELLS